jgi:PAS domain S-box-containing protein
VRSGEISFHLQARIRIILVNCSTPHQHLEEVEMHESEQQLKLYRLLVENSLGLMCIHDLDGVLLVINPAVAQSLGYRVEDGIGRNLREFLSPSVRPMFDKYLQRIRTNAMDSGLMRLQAKDGEERIWFYRNVRYEEPGSPVRILGHALDITERINAENALRESQNDLAKARDELVLRVAERTAELQQANERLEAEINKRKVIEEELLRADKLEALAVLAGGIAHDFNNFLTIVQGNLELAKIHTKPGDAVCEILQQSDTACKRAISLASQLLTFGKGGAPIIRTTAVAQLLAASLDLARAGSQVRFDLAIPDDLWPAEIDAGQISQVFHNLLLNARQAVPEGSVVEVRAENVVIEGGTLPINAGKYVKISIRDHGSGIPPEILPRIFDPYFTTKDTGSGLGLATAYSIVTKHQGHLRVDSTVGQGSTFYVHLPASEMSPFIQPSAVVRRGAGRILVMDDEEAIRRLLELTMSQLGYEVECASDGAEAIELFTRAVTSGRGFDGVLLDLTVPGRMGGQEAAAELRKIDPSVKVIGSSGYADIPILSEFQKYGFDDVIRKPYTRAELSDVLTRVIGGKVKEATTPRFSEGRDELYRLKAPLPAVLDKAGGERVSVILPAGAVLKNSSQRSTTLVGMIGVYWKGQHYSVYPKDLLQKAEHVSTA